MAHHIEFDPVSHLTIGAVGAPGKRRFYLQGQQEDKLISLRIEKEQARLLGSSMLVLWDDLLKTAPLPLSQLRTTIRDMRLKEPIEPLFRVGNMALGYDKLTDKIVIIAYELIEFKGEEPNRVSFWCTRSYIREFAEHIMEVVNSGRPICGNCGKPIDPDGHFCPRSNGHTT